MASHISRTTKAKSLQVKEIDALFSRKYKLMKKEYDSEKSAALAELEGHRKVDSILTAKFRLNNGQELQMGTEMRPTYSDVAYVINKFFLTNYIGEYRLLPDNMNLEVLKSPTKEVVHSLIPLLVSTIERKVIAGQIDVFSPNNRSLILMTATLSWYWYHHLGGARPQVEGLVKIARPKIYQDAPLCCPCCGHQFSAPKNLVLQSAKAWAYLRWLEKHFVEYHIWKKPGNRTAKKSAETEETKS